MNYKQVLLDKITSRSATIGIIGLGYVGLPLALVFAEKGFNVIGFDIDEKKIPVLMEGKSYIKHIEEERIKEQVQRNKFSATADFSLLASCDSIIICVPTPLNEHREPDISFIENSGREISKYLRPGQLVVLESSTYPGTTDEVLLPILEKGIPALTLDIDDDNGQPLASGFSRLAVGQDFFLAFSPEREDPNNPDYSTSTIPKVVGGVTPACLEVSKALYDEVIVQTVPVSSTRVAESAKLLENIYRSVNIALVNELKMVFDKMGIDVWEVIEAAKTKPFGFQAFYPGPGLGGHCIPIDPFYLTWKAKEYGINTRFIELAGDVNTLQPYYVVDKTMEVLNKYQKTLNGSKVLILGAAYKKNLDDLRESPTLKLIEIFCERGAEVDYNDPFVPKLPKTRKYDYDMSSVELTESNLKKYDVVLLSTAHNFYAENAEFIIQNSKLIVDTRNTFKNSERNWKVFKS